MPTPTASPAKRVAKGSLARERILQTALHELEQFDQRLGQFEGRSRASSRTPPSAAGTVKLPTISPNERRALSTLDPSAGQDDASSSSARAPGAGTPKAAPSAHEIKAFLAIRAPLDPAQHMALLESEFQVDQIKTESANYLKQMKMRKAEEELLRKVRERERRKILLDEERKQAAELATEAETALLARLSRQSKHERRIARQLHAVRHEKDVIKSNRMAREQQYAAQREKDYRDALDCDFEASERLRQEYEQKTAMLTQQYRNLLANKAQTKHARHLAMGRQIVTEILDLALKVSEYKELNDGKVPLPLLRDWKTLFLNAKSVHDTCLTEPVGDKIPIDVAPVGALPDPGSLSELAPAVQVLDDEEFLNYLQGEGSWAYRQDPPKTNHVLGKIVSHILSYSLDSENRPAQDPLPPLSLKLCIMGKQFSGKQTIAEQIGRLFDVSIIRADRLVHRAIQIARESASLGVTDGVLLDLGRRAQECLLAGADVDDAVLVGLVAYRIRQIAQQDASAGWILVGFPRTRAQAQLLEKELTGYEEPKPVKPGNIKRSAPPSAGASASLGNGGSGGGGSGGSATATRNPTGDPASTSLRPNSGSPSAKDSTKRRSLITPDGAPAEATTTPAGSGLDLAILLQIPNDAAFRRATGRCVDPVKQQVYHLDFNPPPSDQVGLNTRLVTGDNVAQSQMHLRIAAFEEEEPSLIEWFNRFGNLAVIDSNVPLEVCTAQIEKLLSEIKAKKSKGPDSLSSSTASDPTKAPSSADKDRTKEAKDPKPVNPEDKVKSRGSSAAKSRSSSARKSHNELAKPATPPAPTIVEAPAPPVPPPQKEVRKEPSPRLLQVLSDEWAVLETVFTNTTKYLFRSLRRERETLINYFYEVKRHFEKFVTRPDSKQDLLRAFQEEFNALDDDLRGDPDAKAELHQRTEDLRDNLWGISDERKEQAETERTAIIMSHFVEDHYLIVTECYIGLMQAEMDRFLGTTHIVLDYVKDTQQQLINEGGPRTCPLPKPGSIPTTGKEENLLKLTPSMLNIKREQSASKIKLSVAAVEKSAAKRQTASTAGMLPGGGAAAAAGSVTVPAIGGRSEDTPDHVLFSDLYRAAEVAIALINGLEDDERRTHRDAGKGGKGTGGAAGGAPTATGVGVNVAASGNKTNPNSPVPVGATGMGSSNTGTVGDGESDAGETNPEHTQALRNEEFLTRARVLRILEVGCEHLREIRTRAFEVFSFLDECIGSSFKGEMAAIKDMITVVKQAIELELRLPNALVINGQQFLVDYGTLTFDAELQPRPVSPVETSYADKFTIQQLNNLVAHFRVIAKDGFLTARHFVDFLRRTSTLPNVYDYLPDTLVGHPESFAKLAQALDPHDTGFVSWKKFIVFAALVLPAPVNQIHELHTALVHRPDGLIAHDEFMAMKLWFETEDLTASQRLFNRSCKTKQLFFDAFAVPLQGAASTDLVHARPGTGGLCAGQLAVEWTNPNVMDLRRFAFSCCADPDPLMGMTKALHLTGHVVTASQVAETLAFDVFNEPIYPLSVIEPVLRSASAAVNGHTASLTPTEAATMLGTAMGLVGGVDNPTRTLVTCQQFKYEPHLVQGEGKKATPSTTQLAKSTAGMAPMASAL